MPRNCNLVSSLICNYLGPLSHFRRSLLPGLSHMCRIEFVTYFIIIHSPLCVKTKGAIPGCLVCGPKFPEPSGTIQEYLILQSLPLLWCCLCLKLEMRGEGLTGSIATTNQGHHDAVLVCSFAIVFHVRIMEHDLGLASPPSFCAIQR